MKILSAFVISAVFALPVVASAASFVVAPSTGSYKVGDTVTLNISVNPSGSTVYTAMLDARFSSDTFEVVSFTLNDSLLPLKQSGYDALNNASGILTKTGGYTGGITTTSPFGTVVLRAKTAGTGTLTVADSSKLLDGNNADQQAGSQTNSFTIAAKPVAQPTPTPTKTSVKKEEPKVTAVSAKEVATTETPIEAVTDGAESLQVAAVSDAGASMSTTMLWILWALSVALSFVVGYFLGFRRFGIGK